MSLSTPSHGKHRYFIDDQIAYFVIVAGANDLILFPAIVHSGLLCGSLSLCFLYIWPMWLQSQL